MRRLVEGSLPALSERSPFVQHRTELDRARIRRRPHRRGHIVAPLDAERVLDHGRMFARDVPGFTGNSQRIEHEFGRFLT